MRGIFRELFDFDVRIEQVHRSDNETKIHLTAIVSRDYAFSRRPPTRRYYVCRGNGFTWEYKVPGTDVWKDVPRWIHNEINEQFTREVVYERWQPASHIRVAS